MIPLILADPATGTGKPVPKADATADNAAGDAFGDLMADTEAAADEEPLILPDPTDSFVAEESVELALVPSDPKRAEVAVKVTGPLTDELSKPARPNLPAADTPSDGRPVAVGGRAVVPPFDAEVAVNAKGPATVKGDLSDVLATETRAQRPSVAQTVVQGKLPQIPIPDGRQTNPAQERRAPQVDAEKEPAPRAVPVETKAAPLENTARFALPANDNPAKRNLATPVDDNPRFRREESVATSANSLVSKPATPPVVVGQPPAVALAQAGGQSLRDASDKITSANLNEVIITASPIERQTAQTMQVGPTATATPEVARQVATQIAVAVNNTPGKTTEIALNPEELGRVRLSLSAADGAITLNVLAERPETQDLLRRHMDVLAQEFRQLGYTSISFSFGDQKGEARSDNDPSKDATELEGQEAAETTVITAAPQTTGLDLRI